MDDRLKYGTKHNIHEHISSYLDKARDFTTGPKILPATLVNLNSTTVTQCAAMSRKEVDTSNPLELYCPQCTGIIVLGPSLPQILHLVTGAGPHLSCFLCRVMLGPLVLVHFQWCQINLHPVKVQWSSDMILVLIEK